MSCKDDANSPTTNLFLAVGGSNSGPSEILLDFDKPNLIGLISIERFEQNEYVFDNTGGYTTYQDVHGDLDGHFVNHQRNSSVSLNPATIADFI